MEKKDQIKFVLLTTLLNMVCIVVVTAVLLGLAYVIMKFACHVSEGSIIFAVVMSSCFVVGLILSVFLYTKIGTIIINKKFNNKENQ